MEEVFGYEDAEPTKKRLWIISACCDPNRRPYRFIMLFFLFAIYVCVFFTVELPSGLQTILMKVMNINAKQYNLLFSIFTWPDIALSVFGGIIIDRFIGLRAGIILVAVTALVGEIIFALGGFMNNFIIVLLGRIVLGFGIGIYKNAVFLFIALWFKGKEINFVTSTSVCFCRMGTSLGILVPEMFYNAVDFVSSNSYRVGIAFSLGVLALLIGLLCCIVVVILDKRGATIIDRQPSESVQFKITDLKDFSASFWLATLPLALFYSVLYSYAANGQFFIVSKFGFDRSHANIANALIFIAPIIVTPLFGLLLDFCGYNLVWGLVGALIAVFTHAVYACSTNLSMVVPYVAGISYSLSYTALVTAIYPIPIFIVQPHQLATAYSFYNVLYCILFSVISLVAGYLIDYAGFIFLELYYLLLMFIASASLMMLLLLDLSKGSRRHLLVREMKNPE